MNQYSYFPTSFLCTYLHLVSTWSNCDCWEHVQHCFLNDLEAKGPLIGGAHRQRVKPFNELHLHTVVPNCRLDEVQDLDETACIFFSSEYSLWDVHISQKQRISDSTSCNDCAEWIRRFTCASATEGSTFTCRKIKMMDCFKSNLHGCNIHFL